ncbi:NAD(P)-dependent oxidoreductase [Pseudoalteromonas citrea]|uniref:NAD(P)-dependent oxidoreductase n=1 Tax=Pseudoalteromonas citrea TaxID=43655 RepID=A0A5S3XTN3_9GAMM|nr:NAD(P)-dependent oxidoreductase [Pseudoalteromonas citrea]TMP44336.1 NAD(P)-dependent oxidoreductase [Pseudoalteromonas citrea]TMP60769.1 NAD(P)-dependent oxidoreductase [Pseudoalteromonas citrea]
MKILITGSAGRVGRAIYINLMQQHAVFGLDTTPCSTVDMVADIRDTPKIIHALRGVDVIIHSAALHAPHVGLATEQDFIQTNIDATERLALEGIKQNIKHFVFTSTTALYGFASTPQGQAGWVNEHTQPQPKTIYHTSKIEAENKLKRLSQLFNLPITVLRMSRCFPEPANVMSVYRLTRGIDVRDVAHAHACAISARLKGFRTYIISGHTPFDRDDCIALYHNAGDMLQKKAPDLAKAFAQRHWPLPNTLDRVYDSSLAQKELQWQPKYGYHSVINMLDCELPEVLPPVNLISTIRRTYNKKNNH